MSKGIAITTKQPWLAAVTALLAVLLLVDWIAAGGRFDKQPGRGQADAPQVGAMRPSAPNMARAGGPSQPQAAVAPRGGIAGMGGPARQAKAAMNRPDLGLRPDMMAGRQPNAAQNVSAPVNFQNRPTMNMPTRPGRDNAALAGRPDMGAMRPAGGGQPGFVRPAGLAPAIDRPAQGGANNGPNMPTLQPAGSGQQGLRPGIAGLPRPGGGAGNIPDSRPDLGGGVALRPAVIDQPGQGGQPDGPGNNRPDRPGWANRPDRPGPDRPNWANRPGPDRPNWANRPGWGNRPGDNNSGNNINSGNVTNVTNNNWTNNNQTVINNSPTIVNTGYRPGVAQPGYGYGYQGNWGYGQNGFQDNSWQCGPGWRPAYYSLHGDWHHGNWNGYCNQGNWLSDVSAAAGWLNGWSYGSRLYSWGYTTYSNPYVLTAPQTTTVLASYDYTQPINTESPPPDGAQAAETARVVADARAAFKNGAYERALSLATSVLGVLKNDPTVHEFRALNLFAMGRYEEASQALYPALSVGPGWDWTTMVGLYPDEQTYAGQFTSLEQYARAHANEPAGHFLLAYHYLATGSADAAADELRRVVALQPSDQLSRQILAMLDASAQQAAQPAAAGNTNAPPVGPPAPAPATSAPPPADRQPSAVPSTTTPLGAADLAGKWKAEPDAKTTITLNLQPDGNFVWEVAQGDKSRTIVGQYTLGGELLTLAATQGGAMVGNVSLTPDKQFMFRLMGAPASEAGLAFARQL